MSPGCRQCRLVHHRLGQPQHERLLWDPVEYELLVNANAKDALKTGISVMQELADLFATASTDMLIINDNATKVCGVHHNMA